MSEECKYSCNTATETLEWIHAIVKLIAPYRYFLDAHVVNFFKVFYSAHLWTKLSWAVFAIFYALRISFLVYYVYNFENFWEYMQDRLWEAVDEEWMDCLRKEPVENLLRIPSGVVRVVMSTTSFHFYLFIINLACTRRSNKKSDNFTISFVE